MATALRYTCNRTARTLMISALLAALTGCASSSNSGASPTAGSATATAAGSANEYRISPEDVIEVSVWNEPNLQRTVVVRPDGGISFPLIGNIEAAGRTAVELQDDITGAIEEYVPDASVTVTVQEIKGLKIFVTGQVKKPGQYLIGRYVDVLQALTLAGGLTPFADRRNIRVLRRMGAQEQVFDFDYSQVQRGEALSQNILLQPGDTVIVP